jgi:hypothetical protein
MSANVEHPPTVVEAAGSVRSHLVRALVMIVGTALGLLMAPTESSAGPEDPCPIPGCGDEVGRTCGICQTVNGSYAVYYP